MNVESCRKQGSNESLARQRQIRREEALLEVRGGGRTNSFGFVDERGASFHALESPNSQPKRVVNYPRRRTVASFVRPYTDEETSVTCPPIEPQFVFAEAPRRLKLERSDR